MLLRISNIAIRKNDVFADAFINNVKIDAYNDNLN